MKEDNYAAIGRYVTSALYPTEHDFMAVTTNAFNKIMNQKNGDSLWLLYCFYCEASRSQRTNRPQVHTEYTAKALNWTETKVKKIKGGLRNLGIVEDVQNKNEQGKIIGHCVEIHFI